jgi:hypothetical protein
MVVTLPRFRRSNCDGRHIVMLQSNALQRLCFHPQAAPTPGRLKSTGGERCFFPQFARSAGAFAC